MSSWGKPEYNGIKVLVFVIIIAIAGYFIYNSRHQNSLTGTGQVVSLSSLGGGTLSRTTAFGTTGTGTGTSGTTTTTGTGVGTTTTGTNTSGTTTGTATTGANAGGTGTGTTSKGTTTGKGGPTGQCDNTALVELDPSADNASFPASLLHFDQNFQDAGHFVISNPTPCQWKISSVQLSLLSTYYPATMSPTTPPSLNWQPIYGGVAPGGIKLHLGTATTSTAVSVGSGTTISITTPTGPQFGPTLTSVSNNLNRLLTFNATPAATGPVIIPPYGSQSFALEVGSWNMPAGGTLQMELSGFRAINMGLPGVTFNWVLGSTVMPSTGALVSPAAVTASTLTLVSP